MLANFIRRFKENDKALKQELVRLSGDATQRATNWGVLVFWVFVVAAAILLYVFVGENK